MGVKFEDYEQYDDTDNTIGLYAYYKGEKVKIPNFSEKCEDDLNTCVQDFEHYANYTVYITDLNGFNVRENIHLSSLLPTLITNRNGANE